MEILRLGVNIELQKVSWNILVEKLDVQRVDFLIYLISVSLSVIEFLVLIYLFISYWILLDFKCNKGIISF